MTDPELTLKIAAGILLAHFLMWMIRYFFQRWRLRDSTTALVLSGTTAVFCVWFIGTTL